MSKLRPCPFCSGKARLIGPEESAYCVECAECHASSMLMYAVKDDPRPLVVEAWNRRTAPCVHEFEANPGMTDSTHRYCVHCGRAEE